MPGVILLLAIATTIIIISITVSKMFVFVWQHIIRTENKNTIMDNLRNLQ